MTHRFLIPMAGLLFACLSASAQSTEIVPMLPPSETVSAPFSKSDETNFANPPKVFHPQTWFHYVDGNVDRDGITKDLEAIAGAGIAGVQLFHGGNFGGDWPGVTNHIYCLSEQWEDLVKHTATQARRLGLRFTMQNCPGWAMSGGPWIQPENAMRHLTMTRIDVKGGTKVEVNIPANAKEDWEDYHDVAVLAFKTPVGDTDKPLRPKEVKTDSFQNEIASMLSGGHSDGIQLPASSHRIEVVFPEKEAVRSIVFSSVDGFSHDYVYEPGVHVKVEALFDDKSERTVLDEDMPAANWQDESEVTLSLDEACARRFVITVTNKHPMGLSALRLLSAARKNNWEAEAGWTLRRIPRGSALPDQSREAYIDPSTILDLSAMMDKDGNLTWDAPASDWTIIRFGHVNTGKKNGPAPAEATGFECDKLDTKGADTHFNAFIGRMANGPVKGLVNSMLMDSWECKTQTWTSDMEGYFRQNEGYDIRGWLPAIFGYVIADQETTSRFLNDWRRNLNTLLDENFFGRMASHAKENEMSISYETASGDIFPGDIMEYFKYADVPMAEFWRGADTVFLENFNYKPIYPTASAAHLYGKPRVGSESFTSGQLSWDEHLDVLRETANQNCAQGISYFVMHTYTHNPMADKYMPGTSFGSTAIGTPFVRNQTWWKYMPEFTTCLSRYTYMLERGKPVADVLWYLGDEIDHKPDQYIPFPYGIKFDYCNYDILINRIEAKNGKAVTPEGLEYSLIWIPDNYRMLVPTLRKLISLAQAGVKIVADKPLGSASIAEGVSDDEFNSLVDKLWSSPNVIEHKTIDEALAIIGIKPDVTIGNIETELSTTNGGKAVWMHRKAEGADWYFVAAPKFSGFRGDLTFNCSAPVEIWDPVTGEICSASAEASDNGTTIHFDLPRSGACFVVFRKDADGSKPAINLISRAENIPGFRAMDIVSPQWKISFPAGWGAPESVSTNTLKSWTALGLGEEGSSFSGTATYSAEIKLKISKGKTYLLDLGEVEMIATVTVNGQEFQPIWNKPYRVDISSALKNGKNSIVIDVTNSWWNRLAYDATRPEKERKTWVIGGPAAGDSLRPAGLLGPVSVITIDK